MQTRITALAVLTLATYASPISAQNLVDNPGFETGTFSSWTLIGNPVNNVVSNQSLWVHSGTYAGLFGQTGFAATLSQTLATTAGSTYTLSFWLENGGSDLSENYFRVEFDNVALMVLTNASTSDYTQYTINGLVATGTATPLEFHFQNDLWYWYFDDVSVTAADGDVGSTVPEPASLTLLATGLTGLAAARKRRRSAA